MLDLLIFNEKILFFLGLDVFIYIYTHTLYMLMWVKLSFLFIILFWIIYLLIINRFNLDRNSKIAYKRIFNLIELSEMGKKKENP
jgi:NADH:ubiquinone oxidoreductase subunit H